MRVRELQIFCDALASMKRAAAYMAGDLQQLIYFCRENQFVRQIKTGVDPITAWTSAAEKFFSNSKDIQNALDFIHGYGHSDLAGLLSYIEYFEKSTGKMLLAAENDCAAKGRLYAILGLFSGTVTVILMS